MKNIKRGLASSVKIKTNLLQVATEDELKALILLGNNYHCISSEYKQARDYFYICWNNHRQGSGKKPSLELENEFKLLRYKKDKLNYELKAYRRILRKRYKGNIKEGMYKLTKKIFPLQIPSGKLGYMPVYKPHLPVRNDLLQFLYEDMNITWFLWYPKDRGALKIGILDAHIEAVIKM